MFIVTTVNNLSGINYMLNLSELKSQKLKNRNSHQKKE